jgi:3-isopropylmalate/(R)-2-methylmalate dehydratase small subunit
MEKFTILRGIAAPMVMTNIDTDAIIPSQWVSDMKADLGEKLFADWRYEPDGTEKPDFVLNQPRYRKSRILVAGKNFGCGSSREMAVWALMRFGIKCVIAPSFSDIFTENSFQNGLLPVVLLEERVDAIAIMIANVNLAEITVDLEQKRVELPDHTQVTFSISDERRTSMLEGLDELGQLLRYKRQVDAFQESDRAERVWIYGR